MLEKIRIVLVNPSHPGNIGAAARAMKTMGLTQLVLVAPKKFPDILAFEMSSHAEDILENAQITATLEEALNPCHWAVATTARSRAIALPSLTPRACAEKLIHHAKNNTMAIVFGREDSGLTNEELLHCHYQVHIPSNPEYSSLNLAAAVQVLCYELRVAYLAEGEERREVAPSDELATLAEVERFYDHLMVVLEQLDFLKKDNLLLMPKIRRIFNRIHLEKPEVNILRGILTAVQKKGER